MSIVEILQKAFPWAVDLPFLPKALLSLIICLLAALTLSVLWSSENSELIRTTREGLVDTDPKKRSEAVERLAHSDEPAAQAELENALASSSSFKDVRIRAKAAAI